MSTYQLVRSRNGEDERPRVETVPNPRQLDPLSFVSDTHLPLLLGTDTLVAVVMQAAAYGFTPLRAHLRHIAWRPLTGPEHEIEDALTDALRELDVRRVLSLFEGEGEALTIAVVELLEPEEHDVIRIGRDGVVDVPPARQRDKDLLSALALIAQAGLRQKRYDVGLCPKRDGNTADCPLHQKVTPRRRVKGADTK